MADYTKQIFTACSKAECNRPDGGTLTFLGTGTSQGVPMIGCDCHVCKSAESKDKRLRSSALVEYKGYRILIDCGPDFRYQMLRENISDLDAVLLTHQHKDHTGGLDDIRAFNYFRQKKMADSAFPIYAEERVQQGLKMEFHYAFEKEKYPGVPDYRLVTITDEKFSICKPEQSEIASEQSEAVSGQSEAVSGQSEAVSGQSEAASGQSEAVSGQSEAVSGKSDAVEVTPIRVMHYKLPILGFRFGNLAYITDGSFIPESEFSKLEGLETLIINTVRHEKHISHFSLPEALEIIRRVGAPNNYLTHLSHQIGTHAQLTAELENEFPANREQLTGSYGKVTGQKVFAAYDGLQIFFN